MTSFDKKMASLIAVVSSGMVALGVSACSSGVVAGAGGLGAALGISASTLSTVTTVANDMYTAGQLFCQSRGTIVAVVDQITKKPFLVTGKSATVVADTCALIDPAAIPTPPPQVPTAVPAVVVVPATDTVPAAATAGTKA